MHHSERTFLDLVKDRAVGIAEHLRHAVVVAQVDEEHAAMVADAVHPARQADGVAHVGFGQLGAGMAAICVHGRHCKGARPGARANS
jgi:hypothetical protein